MINLQESTQGNMFAPSRPRLSLKASLESGNRAKQNVWTIRTINTLINELQLVDGRVTIKTSKPYIVAAMLSNCAIECQSDSLRVSFILPEWLEVKDL